MQILRDQLGQLSSQPPEKLGFATVASLAISLWSANGGVKAIFEGLNAVYEEREKRSFVKLNAVSLVLTLGVIAFVIASLMTITVIPKLLSILGLPGLGEIVGYGRWPLLLIVASMMIAAIYRFRPKPRPASMALDITGKRICRRDLDRCLATLLLVHGSLRQLQQDVRLTRRCGWLHDLDLDIHDGHPRWRQDQRGAQKTDCGRFRLMGDTSPLLWSQASEGEAQHGPFCCIGGFDHGSQHLHCG